MKAALSFFTIGVENLSVMTAFYRDVLAWKPLKSTDELTFFKLNGCILGLYPTEKLAADIGIIADGKGFKRFAMAINYDSIAEVDALFDTLISKGVRIVKAPEKVYWGGYRGYFADPEDNYWEIAYNPALTPSS